MNTTSQPETLQIKKIFWGWEDDKEEAWLREQARAGRHLAKVEWGLYTFAAGEPRDVVYRMDYINTSDPKKVEEYRQFFQDAGWEHIGELLGWHYFRKPYRPGEQDEIYSDPESKIEKYRRLLYYLLGMLPITFFPVLNMTLITQTTSRSSAAWVLAGLLVVLLLIEAYMLAHLLLRIRQLKRL